MSRSLRPALAGALLALLLPACDVANREVRRADTVVSQADLDVDLPAIKAKLDRLTGTRSTRNRVTLLHLGKTSRPERVRLIEGAERTVFQTVPYWFDDEEGRFFRDLIREKKRTSPDVDVRLLLDWSSPGSTGDLFGTKMFASLREVTGGNALLWNEPQWQRRFSADLLRNRMHEKLLVVDGDKLLMGGMNVADDYLQGGVTRKGWHDTDLLIEGPAAAEAQKVFLKLWELSKYLDSPAPFPAFEKEETRVLQKLFYEDDGRFQVRPPAQGGKKPALVDTEIPFRKYLGDPFYFPELAPRPEWTTPLRFIYDNTLVDRNPRTGRQVSKIMDTLIWLIRMSRSSVLLFVPYLTPHEDFLGELEKAAKAGKTVVIVTNSERSHDIGTIPWKAGTTHYGKLLDAGVHLFEWQGHADLLAIEEEHGCTIPDGQWPGRTIHSKVALIDGKVALVGSHNFNVRSESFNNEAAALVDDRAVGRELVRVFVDDLDLDEAKRTVPCGASFYARPRRVKQILPADSARFERENGGTARLLSRLQGYM